MPTTPTPFVGQTTCVCFTSYSDIEHAPQYGDGLSYLIYQREKGKETEREHWQGYAECSSKSGWIRTQWQRALGVGACHLEKRKGTALQAATYCRKRDGQLSEPVEFGTSRGANGSIRTGGDAFGRALGADSYSEALAILETEEPEKLMRSFVSIDKCLKRKFEPEAVVYTTPAVYKFAFEVPQTLERWVNEELPKPERAKMLVLVGPTRLGKTAWARSLCRHIFWRGATNMKDWDDEAKLLVLDDIEWQYLPYKKSLCCQMGQCTVTDKYCAKKTINSNKPAIFCCNELPDWGKEAAYWTANTTIVFVDRPLFSNTQLRL